MGKWPLVNGHSQPVSANQLPIANRQSPIPIANQQSAISIGNQQSAISIGNRQSPIANQMTSISRSISNVNLA
jgi:hypothetical protein